MVSAIPPGAQGTIKSTGVVGNSLPQAISLNRGKIAEENNINIMIKNFGDITFSFF
jgi:hypothetical protein